MLDAEIDDEDLVEELTALLHLSPYSDDFGFDLLGWLDRRSRLSPVAMCIEAKNSAESRFHFSTLNGHVRSNSKKAGSTTGTQSWSCGERRGW